jgi:hypothetical protein
VEVHPEIAKISPQTAAQARRRRAECPAPALFL